MKSPARRRGLSRSARLLVLIALTFVGALATAPLLKAGLDAAVPRAEWLHDLVRYEADPEHGFTYDFGRVSRRWLALWALVVFVGLHRWVAWGDTVRDGLRDPHRTRHLGRGLLLGALLVMAYAALLAATGTVDWTALPPAVLAGYLVEYLVAAAVIALVEEVFFRAVVLGTMVADWGRATGVTAATAVFALLHTVSGYWRTPPGADPLIGLDLLRLYLTDGGTVWFDLRLVIGLGLLGWLLALLTLRTGSIWAAIGVHGSLVLMSKMLKKAAVRTEGFSEVWLGDPLFIVSGVATWGLLAAALVAAWLALRPRPNASSGSGLPPR